MIKAQKHNILLKHDKNIVKCKINYQSIAQDFWHFTQVAKFNKIWSHWVVEQLAKQLLTLAGASSLN